MVSTTAQGIRISTRAVWNYIEVLKPRETALLVFIGVVTAVVAGGGVLPVSRLILTLAAIICASAGANGLTNYLDRELDARMTRTRNRALPSKRIYPPEKVLPLTIGLSLAGLALAWRLHPIALLFDLVGTAAAVVWRKRVTCVFPQGAIASCAPVLMGWFAARTDFAWEIILLCVLIAVWLPSHIWSIMVANRDDYRNAGITYFPVNRSVKSVAWILLACCVVLYAASIALYFVGGFGVLYLVVANVLCILVIYAGVKLARSKSFQDAWKLYKLSAFPYLGVIFLVMLLDILLI